MRQGRQQDHQIISVEPYLGFSTLDLEYKVFLKYFKFLYDNFRLTDRRLFQYFQYVSPMKVSFFMQNRNYTILTSS